MRRERKMNPKCQTRPGFDTFSAKSAHLTGLKMRRITRAASFDHLVSEAEEIVGDFQSESPRGSQVDYQLEFGRLMDRQLRGLGPLQNLRGIDAVLAVTLSDAHTVAHQSARDRIFTKLVDRRQPLPRRESDDPIAARIEVRSGCDQQRPRALLH